MCNSAIGHRSSAAVSAGPPVDASPLMCFDDGSKSEDVLSSLRLVELLPLSSAPPATEDGDAVAVGLTTTESESLLLDALISDVTESATLSEDEVVVFDALICFSYRISCFRN